VRFALTDEQAAMAEAVRDLLADQCPPATVRASWEPDGDEQVRGLLRQLGGSGLLSLLVPEADGGLGLDEVTMVAVLEQVGYAAAPGPVTDTVTVAAPLLAAAGHPDAEAVLAGELVVASGLGRTGPIPHAQVADLVLLDTDRGPRALTRDEVELSPVDSVDGARRLAEVHPQAEGVAVGDDDGHRTTLGNAAELVGLAQRMLDLTVDYVQQREQFGRPVGTFQAVKHQLADSLQAVAFARPAVRRAGATLADRADTGERDVAVAKATASHAAGFVAQRAIQCHGAIGYTVEYDLHLFAKRAWALRADRGDASEHRRRVADELAIPAASG
jgi:alkylation response protein AidB-like acyl-CoA dehydrogenase